MSAPPMEGVLWDEKINLPIVNRKVEECETFEMKQQYGVEVAIDLKAMVREKCQVFPGLKASMMGI